MTRYQQLLIELQQAPKTWLVTGVAGVIGSNLLGYAPTHTLAQGVAVARPWYVGQKP